MLSTMTQTTGPRQTDYLAIQVERLADAVEGLSDRLRAIELRNAGQDGVSGYRGKQAESQRRWRERIIILIYGSAISLGVWVIQKIVEHLK